MAKKRRAPVTGELIAVRIQPDMLRELDDFRAKQPDLPSRPEAMRRLHLPRVFRSVLDEVRAATDTYENREEWSAALDELAHEDVETIIGWFGDAIQDRVQTRVKPRRNENTPRAAKRRSRI
jgi:hypothetical protein